MSRCARDDAHPAQPYDYQVGDELEQLALDTVAQRLRVAANEQGRALDSARVVRQLGVPREQLQLYADNAASASSKAGGGPGGGNDGLGAIARHAAGAGGIEEHAQLAGDHAIESCLFYTPARAPPPPSSPPSPPARNAAEEETSNGDVEPKPRSLGTRAWRPPCGLAAPRRLGATRHENSRYLSELTSGWGVEVADVPIERPPASPAASPAGSSSHHCLADDEEEEGDGDAPNGSADGDATAAAVPTRRRVLQAAPRVAPDAGGRGVFAKRAFDEGGLLWDEEPLLTLSLRDDVCALCAAPLAPRGGGVPSRCGAERCDGIRASAWRWRAPCPDRAEQVSPRRNGTGVMKGVGAHRTRACIMRQVLRVSLSGRRLEALFGF